MVKRTLVTGDIHGGLKALEQVLERAGTGKDDRLIFLGDYVDGWSDSSGIIGFLNDLSLKNECVFIMGNHDYFHLRELEEQKNSEINPDIKFFRKCCSYYIDEENRLFVHAGFLSKKGVLKEKDQKELFNNRTFWRQAYALYKSEVPWKNWPETYKLYKEVYIGHTPTLKYGSYSPMHCGNVWNMDTGASYDGPLSMMDIDSREIWRSEPVYLLYPSERGKKQVD